MVQIQAKPRQTIPLGHRGENEAREIIFDLADYISTYGPGTARLLHQRDGDPAPYIVPAVQDEATLTWTVTDEDTAAPGTGSAELQWTVNNALAKSDIWNTRTKAALDDGATAPPTGAEGWYQQLITYIDSLRGEGVSEEQIAQAVTDYLTEHPIEETDPTVPDWAKQPEKPSYTADEVGALSAETLPEAINTALAQAKASGEFDGAAGQDGAPGQDGITPTIGDNGNWYLGETDTGKPSRGKDGATGATGEKGADGKSAYQYAQDGGYTGTEAEFAAKLAEEIPDALPNPNALTFTGAVTGSYDGSAPLEVDIPSGGGGLTVTNTAAVGQTVKITAVGENGQPTEWEAVDFSSGGDAEKSVRHIATVAVTTGTTSYSVTVDSNGNALNLESVYILTEKFWGSNGSYVQVDINGKLITKAFGQSGSPQVLELEKMGELQKVTNIQKPSDVRISFGDYYNGKSAVTSVSFWSATSNVNTTIEIYGVDA